MSLMRYEPWSLFDQLRRELDRAHVTHEDGAASTSDWVPAVDVREDTESFLILADVPGVEPQAIEITAENGMLTIKGERRSETKEEREGYKRIERSRGTFFRRFTLPDTADTDRITAKSANGVLEIRIPKHERVQPRKITIEA